MKRYSISITVICIIGLLVFGGSAFGWSWYGFSDICVDDQYRGKEGWTKFQITQATVVVQCRNINTNHLSQPGIGNGGDAGLEDVIQSVSTKLKGVVSLDGCIDLGIFDDPNNSDHINPCHPDDNENKEAVKGTAWVSSFTAEWQLYNVDPNEYPDADPKNTGTDICEWNGPFVTYYTEDGIEYLGPEHNYPFDCTSTSDKKINFITTEE